MCGLEPNTDIEIHYTGVRPGEKLFEELLTAEEGTTATQHESIYTASSKGLPEDRFDEMLAALFHAAEQRDVAAIQRGL